MIEVVPKMSSKEPSWVGQQLGNRYEIEDLIDRGGMASVYRATDPNLKRKVAIKIIHPHLTDNPEFIQRFEQEAASIAQLRHNNIVQVHDFNRENNTYYMVMEYVAGESLADKLKALNHAQMRLPIKDSINILAKVCKAVDYAHQRFMIHRDIKPGNVVINLLGEPILMDFGIAKILGSYSHTATGAAMGTATYMSPEQAKGDISDHRTDIYSLGIMLYELLSGEPPFMGSSSFHIMMKHINEPVPDIRQFDSNTPIALINILNQALSKEPDERYQSAAEMATALETASIQLQGSVTDTLAVRYLNQLATLRQQASDLFNAGRYAACIDKLGELVQIDPDFQRMRVDEMRQKSIDKLFERTTRLYQNGKYPESLEALEALRQRSPDETEIEQLDRQIRLGMGNQTLITKLDSQYKEAAALLEARTYDQALAKWGIIQRQSGDVLFEDTLDVERRAIEGICVSLYSQALTAVTKNEPEQALQLWRKLAAYDPSFKDVEQVKATAESMLAARRKKVVMTRVTVALMGIILVVVIFLSVSNLNSNSEGVAGVEPTSVDLMIVEPTSVEATAVSTSSLAAIADDPTATLTAVPTNTPAPTETITPTVLIPTNTPEQITAVAQQPATLFETPNSTAVGITFISLDESVTILGRTDNQSWLFIRTDENEEGYVAASRFDFSIAIVDLPIISSSPVSGNLSTPTASGNFAAITADIYPLDDASARCESDNWYVKIFVEGRGGNGVYSYYWDDVIQVENVSDGFSFEIMGFADKTIGTVRIVSGDGQNLFHELFVPRPEKCG